ncbi:hypothetical protein [Lysobacter sp. Hz 25]|uniref:hypothetical protein n=1 Tax=Lysobacter sp. Hz 25 TaxID=3383698 RepID=UPI0038D46BD5
MTVPFLGNARILMKKLHLVFVCPMAWRGAENPLKRVSAAPSPGPSPANKRTKKSPAMRGFLEQRRR